MIKKLNFKFVNKRIALKISIIVAIVVILLQLLSSLGVFFIGKDLINQVLAGFVSNNQKISQETQAALQNDLDFSMKFNTEIMAAVSAQNIYNLESVESAVAPFFGIKELMAVIVRDDSDKIINVFYNKDGSIKTDTALPEGYPVDQYLTKEAVANFDGSAVGKVQIYFTDALLKQGFEKRQADSQENLKVVVKLAEETRQEMMLILSLGQIIVLVLFVIIIFFIVNKMIAPVKQMVSFIDEMSLGNLKNRIQLKRIDEIGIMGQALDSFVDNLKQKADFAEIVASGDLSKEVELVSDIDTLGISLKSMNDDLGTMISQITQNSVTLSGSSEQLTRVSSQISEGTDKMAVQSDTITSASTEMSSNISTMASGAEEMNANIQSISATSTQMSQNMTIVLESVEGIESTTNDVANKSKNSTEVANRAKEMSESTKIIMEELSVSAHEIGEVTEMIKELAQKTNLLALNANIEAASAGDAGKGFAVVANEIKELAKQSADSAQEIAMKVTGIQQNTGKSETANNEMSEIVFSISDSSNHITELAVEQSKTVQIIVSNMRESTTGVKEIARLISEMSAGVEDNARSSSELTLGSNEISKNMSRLDNIIQETAQGVNQVNTEAQSLTVLATQLQELVQKFKLD
ncbi:MAG: methyl-accepting chemotaxis protein [Deltaproteobacteria bacterium]|jgi:methyl-accepting chemotaxis protein|nr:methyl-accepting chemotaxis protein [Deltaproteobacteria bacterium]